MQTACTEAFFLELGYVAVRQLPDGRWIGVQKFLYTTGLCVGLDEFGYAHRYCYARTMDALLDAVNWDGTDDPPGPWIKLKGHRQRGDVLGPGWEPLIEENL